MRPRPRLVDPPIASRLVLDYRSRPPPPKPGEFVYSLLCWMWTMTALSALIGGMLVIEMIVLVIAEYFMEHLLEWRAVRVIAFAALAAVVFLWLTLRLGRKLLALDARAAGLEEEER